MPSGSSGTLYGFAGVQPGQFFKFRGGRALTREQFVEAVRRALTLAGHNASHVCWPQLLNWRCYDCGTERNSGLTH